MMKIVCDCFLESPVEYCGTEDKRVALSSCEEDVEVDEVVEPGWDVSICVSHPRLEDYLDSEYLRLLC